MPHLVLLGDSVFDNAAYVAGGPDVLAHVRGLLPAGWAATLLAMDGATTAGIGRQLQRLPRDATHLVVSVGGNDALGHIGILDRPARSTAEVLDLLAEIRTDFADAYQAAVAPLLEQPRPVVLCTIYDGNLPDRATRRRASAALTVFNDVIVRTAARAGVGLIDLRLVCADPGDYANPIEPSVQGGAKIARAILRAIALEETARATRVTVG